MNHDATRTRTASLGPARSAFLGAALSAIGCNGPGAAPPPVAEVGAKADSAVVMASAEMEVDPDELLDRTFDDIKFDIEPGDPFDRSLLTDEVRGLDGQRMRIRGYILPTAQKRGIKQFVLVRDNQECCFGPGAALYDCILVKMRQGESAGFTMRPVAVEGRFRVEEFRGPDDLLLAIYRMEGETVE